MMNVISFSGGRTSAYMVHLFEQKRISHGIDVDYIYCDTGAEHPKTYEFIRNVVNHFKINLTCLRTVVSPIKGVGSSYQVVSLDECKPDLKPFTAVCEVYHTPSFAAATCTREMKNVPSRKYCKDRYGNDYKMWLGIRVDEPKRLKVVDNQVDMFTKQKKPKREIISYLASIDDSDKQDILEFWAAMPFDLDLPEHLGNCVFCVKKGSNKVALAAMDEPEMAKQFIDMIDSESIVVRPGVPFPKEVMYRNHESLKQIIETHKDIDRDTLTKSIRSMKRFDAGSCTESCDAIGDLFS